MEIKSQGATYDTGLSPLGVTQAQKLHNSNQSILPRHPTRIVSSPLLRARQTAMYAFGFTDENFGLRIVCDKIIITKIFPVIKKTRMLANFSTPKPAV